MNESIKIFIRRFFELLITSFIISAVLTFLNKNGILEQRNSLVVGIIIGAVIFFFLNIKMLRECYFCMGKHHMAYYVVNAASYILFAALCFVVYAFCSNEVYAWLFAITKWIRFTVNGVEIYISALLFHIVGLATVFFAPAGIDFDGFIEE